MVQIVPGLVEQPQVETAVECDAEAECEQGVHGLAHPDEDGGALLQQHQDDEEEGQGLQAVHHQCPPVTQCKG